MPNAAFIHALILCGSIHYRRSHEASREAALRLHERETLMAGGDQDYNFQVAPDLGPYTPTPTTGYTGGCYPSDGAPACSRNTHYFECKHVKRCYCGMTARLPLEVDEGL